MDKREERGRSKKVIAGIALTAIIVATVMAAMAGSAAAAQGGTKYNVITPGPSQKVLMGQDVEFVGFHTTPPTVYRYVAGDLANTYEATTDNGRYFIYSVNWPASGACARIHPANPMMNPIKTSGAYYVNGGPDGCEAPLSYECSDMPLRLRVKDKDVTSIVQGTPLNVDVDGIDLFYHDRVDLEIMGPDGQVSERNGIIFKNITVSRLKSFTALDTSGWGIGHYTFQVKIHHPDFACGLNDQSVKKELNIMPGTVQIKAYTIEVPEHEIVRLTVTGIAGRHIMVESEYDSKNVEFPVGLDDNPADVAEHPSWFKDTIDYDGVRNYAVQFNDTGVYTIKVTDTVEYVYDTVNITVTEKGVIFDLPSTVIIGEKFEIGGTANTGDTVDIAVEGGIVEKLNVPKTDVVSRRV